ncbi:SPOR domain-containing protein [Paenibacillus sp. CF384]|uniref:SPOR domain-containing protein n=1 Tax=Paenibacillus sp. CF384 TaxID=1884382 RepID=UPI00089B1D78|nr:SPOR domain-containing protein [Paenibacillus sp. CF384]SDX40477.1 Sporulation related domain-containing protein [Paenibacillus sp. CF384]
MSAKGRITYRFDRQSGAREEQKPEQKQELRNSANVIPFFQEEMKFTSEIGSWNSPFQNDAHALEQLIRDADGQHTRKPATNEPVRAKKNDHPLYDAAQEQLPPHFEQSETILLGDEYEEPRKRVQAKPNVIDMYPILGEEVEESERRRSELQSHARTSLGSYMNGSNQRPTKGPSWFKVFASVTGAIATGALFGYFVLAMFTGNGSFGSESSVNQPGASVSGAITDGAGTTNQSDSAASGGKVNESSSSGAANSSSAADNGNGSTAAQSLIKVNIPESSYYMLQYGVFSNKEGLSAAVDELAAKGLAAAPLTTQEDYRVYVGMSPDRDEAQMLGHLLTNMDVYVKQIDLPAVSSIAFKGEASAVEGFFEQTSELIASLDRLTVERLSGGADDAGDWKELHQQWITSANALAAGLTDKVNKSSLQKLTQLINSAAVAAEEYTKKPSDAYLWDMQASLMKAVFAEKAWFESMDAL